MSEAEELKKRLFNKKCNGWEIASEEEKNNIFNYAEGYINYLNKGKTEREIVKISKEIAENNGFKNICECQEL